MWNYWYSMDNFRGIFRDGGEFYFRVYMYRNHENINDCKKKCQTSKTKETMESEEKLKKLWREYQQNGYDKGGKKRSKKKSSKRKSKRKSSKKGRKSRRKRRTRK